jgi:diguanylate cyclase (GGDEF)-like protein
LRLRGDANSLSGSRLSHLSTRATAADTESMRSRDRVGRFPRRLTLTQQVALMSLVPIVALGFILARVLQEQMITRTLADTGESAQLIARLGIQPRLTPGDLRDGLSARGVHELDEQLRARSVHDDLARIKIWNNHGKIVYSDEHSLIGQSPNTSGDDDLHDALEGEPDPAEVVTPAPGTETASEVGLGRLVEVYVPLRFAAAGAPAGAFEIYLSYRPIASALTRDKRMIVLLITIGLGLLWAILYRIVARASRRLRQQADENDRLARYDQLTGLPNRTLFIEGIEDAVRRSRRQPGTFAVLLIDLDGFTEINNTLGTANGDLVLREVAHRLRGAVRDDTLVARLAGDGYAVLAHGTQGVADALSAAAAIQASFESAIVLDDVEVRVEASIGIAVMGEHADVPDVLLQRADAALAHARSHHSGIEVYSPECDHFDATRLKLLTEVSGALERGEFILQYQPQIDLQSGRIAGVEALVRWHHPEHGVLAPSEFIPPIEQTALIGPLTLALIDQAVGQLVTWRDLGIDIRTSVNLSARNLLDTELPQRVAEILDRHQMPPDRLTVEVTESAAMTDPHRAIAVLAALRATGVGVSVDDFGTGNASIEYLAKLPASELKIDRSFITDILDDPRAEAIVRSTIDLARNLELTVVAEGIETEAVLNHLIELGCDTGQGYLISRPQPAEQLTATLKGSREIGSILSGTNRAKPKLTRV